MGITSNDIAAQRAMIERGEEKRKAARQAEERKRLRDTFAAAALTGMLANEDLLADDDKVAETAYGLADAMLRERARTGAVDGCETAGSAPAADGTGWPTSGAGPAISETEREAMKQAIDAAYDIIPAEPWTAATLRRLLARLA